MRWLLCPTGASPPPPTPTHLSPPPTLQVSPAATEAPVLVASPQESAAVMARKVPAFVGLGWGSTTQQPTPTAL